MKGIVLAGGTGSRLGSLTKVTNKHLLPVGGMPMIEYPIRQLINAGIKEILVVTGTEHMGDIVRYLGSGAEFGAMFTYRVQDEAGGIAQALGLARGFCYGERLCVILGDNIFEDDISSIVYEYHAQDRGARVVIKEVAEDELTRFGVAHIVDDKVVSIVEKPSYEQLKNIAKNSGEEKTVKFRAITGVYFYDQRVFEIISSLTPSARGELEITDVNRFYMEMGELQFSTVSGWWTDAGTLDSLNLANNLVRKV